METLKIDRTKLLSIPDYAKLMGVQRQTVYNWLKDPVKSKTVTTVTISGKTFIQI